VSGLLNIVGLTLGAALYAMLLAMVVGSRQPRTATDRLLVATALLGLAWNVCALWIYELPGFRSGWIAVAGFSALGFLPAVVVHSVLRGERRPQGGRAMLLAIAYSASAVATVLHVTAVVSVSQVPSVLALQLLTVCFIGMLPALWVLTRGQPGGRRAIWGVALAAFAVSALHLTQQHEGASTTWPIELVGHHASIPLAVAILYQDYPFAFADLFLKRALTLTGLVGAVSIAVSASGVALGAPTSLSPTQVSLFIGAWVAITLAYPWLSRGVAWFVDVVLLTRPNYRVVEAKFTRRIDTIEDPALVLDHLGATLSDALSAAAVRWRQDDAADARVSELVKVDAGRRAEICVPVTEQPRYVVDVDGLTGGRRILSGDVMLLSAVALVAARRIDAIRLAQERYAQQLREREIAQLATEAELRALRAQLNPHFLFNALTTIGYLVQEAPNRAVDTLVRLTTLLRAVLKSEGEFTTLGRELEIIDAYLAIELARFEQRLRVRVDVPPECQEIRVPALLIQPLVENAVKHGISSTRSGGQLTISARLDGVASSRTLRVTIADAANDASRHRRRHGWKRGVGLSNVERRLDCHYGRAASLTIRPPDIDGTVVEVIIPAPLPARALERSAG
jgi:two-component system, LytTR family, sensor kinase